ncbi:MAG: sterol desaturase family protein [Bacteroidota bacterium]
MNLNPVILAIPMYFILMAIELVYEHFSNKKTYRLNDAITNISTGILQQVTGTFLKIITVGIYTLVFEYFRFFTLEANWTSFFILFILWDLCYYWDHRMAHRVSLFWGGHSVHHQSEDYNLSVALRQSSTSKFWSLPFYLPLALVGFDPVQFTVVGGLNLLYQFWIHTEHIDRLPRWFEAVMNTPSHHRVHHGRDPKYIDKNYAGVFIVWDRMFGSFKAEEERPNYGVTKPINSWNPVYANFAHYIDLWAYLKKVKSAGDALKILFNPPGWLPEYLGGFQAPQEVTTEYKKYNVSTHRFMGFYVFAQFVASLLIIVNYFLSNETFSSSTKLIYAVWIVLTTLIFGFLFERKLKWVSILEYVRLISIPLGLWALNQFADGVFPIWLIVVTGVFALVSVFLFSRWLKN